MKEQSSKLVTFLWFDNQAEEAVSFYQSVFKDVKIGAISRYDEAGAEVSGQPEGSAMTVEFVLFNQPFMALNGGPHFQFTPAVSFLINCQDQAEIDHYWAQLSADPEAEQCGWLKDRYGVSWQIVPSILSTLTKDKDPDKAGRVVKAMLQMKKIEIPKLIAAYEGV